MFRTKTQEPCGTRNNKKNLRRRSYLVVQLSPYATVLYVLTMASVIEYISLMQSNLLFNTNNLKFRREKSYVPERAHNRHTRHSHTKWLIDFSHIYRYTHFGGFIGTLSIYCLFFFSYSIRLLRIPLSLIYALQAFKIRSPIYYSETEHTPIFLRPKRIK